MSCYISSNNNRFYVAAEQSYGQAAAVSARNRIPAVRLDVRQNIQRPRRVDKTGSRTYLGTPRGTRKETSFELTTLLTDWDGVHEPPSYGPLFEAALGRPAVVFSGGTVASAGAPNRITFSAPHGLIPDQAITFGGEIRFAQSVVDDFTIVLNAPFTQLPAPGSSIGPTATYLPATALPSITVYDYWDPPEAVQRVITGCAVNRLRLRINGDFHQFGFDGPAADMIDTATFQPGFGALMSFPQEPIDDGWNHTVVPGNLGQAWLGSANSHAVSLLHAELTLLNNIQLRSHEYGFSTPRCFGAGMRRISLDFTVLSSPETTVTDLWQCARFRAPISVMFQLGDQPRQMCGVYMKAVIPEVPIYNDDESQLRWEFRDCDVQGLFDDEISIAFG
jgi:hypothetical protein